MDLSFLPRSAFDSSSAGSLFDAVPSIAVAELFGSKFSFKLDEDLIKERHFVIWETKPRGLLRVARG